MKKTIASLAVIAAMSAPAFAQAPAATTPANPPAAQQRSTEVDTQRLIGRNVKNTRDETIGEINSVIIGRDGSVASVIVGVGGFLGIGRRDVAIRWQDLQVANNGELVRTALTREQLQALPEYRYADNQRRGTVFSTTPMPAQQAAAPAQPPATQPAATQPPAAPANGAAAAPAAGEVSANDVIGASVRNNRNESIGRVYDIVMDGSGSVRSLVVSSGGVLGIGERRTAVRLGDVRIMRDGEAVFVATTMTAEQLARAPEYRPH